MTLLLLSLVSACLGSFLSMFVYRFPRQMDMVFKRSHCPQCKHELGLLSLIPVLSFVMSKGRCRYCKAPIPWRYLMIELSSIFGLTSLYLMLGLNLLFFKAALFWLLGTALFFIDLETKLLPDRLTALMLIMGLIFGVIEGRVADVGQGIFVGGGVYWLILIVGQLIYRKPVMGMGDVKLGAGIGAFWGVKIAGLTVYLSFILGGLIGVLLVLLRKQRRQDEIPFGPIILLGAGAAFWLGDWVLGLMAISV